jgi:transglutaminase-like putative cysteine protease
VTAFEVLRPHTQLKITANTVVEILPSFSGLENLKQQCSATWEDLGADNVLNAFAEFLTPTPATTVPRTVVELARTATRDRTPFEAAEAICLAIRDHLDYVPGVTTVHTPAAEAWEHKRGVCQDMAHLALGALRAVGIPARYVSGYLHPKAQSAIGETVNGESHAWVEFWAGDFAHTSMSHDSVRNPRWVGYDPTNRKFAGTDHIVVGRGRDYYDVPPLKGVYSGSPDSSQAVTVQITRIA